MSQTNPIARYRQAAARLRALEAAATKAWKFDPVGNDVYVCGQRIPCQEISGKSMAWVAQVQLDHGVDGDGAANARLICASRNLLLPLLDAGDELVVDYEKFVAIGCPVNTARILKRINAISEAIEREIGEAQ